LRTDKGSGMECRQGKERDDGSMMTVNEVEAVGKSRRAVGVIGLGYVGLPLAMEFCRCGFDVQGVDLAIERVALLAEGRSYIDDVSDAEVDEQVSAGRLHVSSDYSSLKDAQAVSVCVPTPLRKTKTPDMSYVVEAAKEVAGILKRGQLIVLESTVYPGATEELIAPLLQRSGLEVGKDFYLAFSPERVDPGNREFGLRDIPKVVGGVTPQCTQRAVELYREVFAEVIPLESTREAEMAKLLENTFRAVNIGLINELAVSAHKMGIDIWNVIAAAKSKPFGFMAFYPGPGLGAHCLPIDPMYLLWKAKHLGTATHFIEIADKVNTQMPAYVVERTAELLNRAGKPLKDSRILVLGVAYKANVNDVRESPALDVIELLEQRGAKVAYNDPHVPIVELEGRTLASQAVSGELLAAQDCVIVITGHSVYDWEFIAQNARLVFDTRNATFAIVDRYTNISRL